jgi:signal transduction histidine kinase/CheY-like chemotaxis protein
MSAKLPTGLDPGVATVMQPEDFRSDDLFAQINGLVEALAAERHARVAAEAADKAKSELLATVGQELRTPMEAVVAMAESLLATPLDATQQRHAETLLQSARSLFNVLNDLLDFSRLEAGRFEPDPVSFDLHGLIQEVATVLQTRANDKGLTGGADIGVSCPHFIVADATRLRQILMGLIETALKYTSIGSVRLHASAKEDNGRLQLRVDVIDTGVGLSKAVQERLFRPCIEINDRVEDGTGLGLPIARKLAELMGGQVGCKSVVGQGSLYWLTLPAEHARASVAATREAQDVPPQSTLSGHVLVVEDNVVNRMLIGNYLNEFGLTHEIVGSGNAALMCLATKTYDLVLMDTAMPDLDGIETTRRIRSMHVPSAEVPIVAVVVQAKKQHTGTYLSAGMDAYVTKPISAGELHSALAPFLTREQQAEPMLRLVKGQPSNLPSAPGLEVVDQHAREQDQIGDQQESERIGREKRQRHDHADNDQNGDDDGDEEGLSPRRAQAEIHDVPHSQTPRKRARFLKSSGKPQASRCGLFPGAAGGVARRRHELAVDEDARGAGDD